MEVQDAIRNLKEYAKEIGKHECEKLQEIIEKLEEFGVRAYKDVQSKLESTSASLASTQAENGKLRVLIEGAITTIRSQIKELSVKRTELKKVEVKNEELEEEIDELASQIADQVSIIQILEDDIETYIKAGQSLIDESFKN